MPRRSKLTPFHDLIGTVPDREIATMADASIASVHHYRKKHNIPSFRSTLAPGATPAPSAAVPAAPEAEAPQPEAPSVTWDALQGFAVTVELAEGPQERFLLAENLLAATIAAVKVGRVTRVTHLGPALV